MALVCGNCGGDLALQSMMDEIEEGGTFSGRVKCQSCGEYGKLKN